MSHIFVFINKKKNNLKRVKNVNILSFKTILFSNVEKKTKKIIKIMIIRV